MEIKGFNFGRGSWQNVKSGEELARLALVTHQASVLMTVLLVDALCGTLMVLLRLQNQAFQKRGYPTWMAYHGKSC